MCSSIAWPLAFQRKELRSLLRKGVPLPFRTRIWSRCVEIVWGWVLVTMDIHVQSSVQVDGQDKGGEGQCCWSWPHILHFTTAFYNKCILLVSS